MHDINKAIRLPGDCTFERLRHSFVLIARRRVDYDEAEDIAHEACMTVLQKYDTGQHSDHFEAWAYQILRNKIGDHLRKNRVKQVASGKLTAASNEKVIAPDHELRRRIRQCLGKLARANRRYIQILKLTIEGYDTSEICRYHDITPQNLYVLLNRSRNALRTCLKGGRR